ncbi:non-ribosomal peptide synthetase component F [Bradyrhizobium elkanii]
MSGTAAAAPRGGIARVSRRVMNLAYILTQNARRHGDRPGFIWNEKAWSWRHIDQNVSALAAALAARGIVKGDRILVHSKNCDEMFWSMFAAFRLGAVWVPTNFRLMPDEVRLSRGSLRRQGISLPRRLPRTCQGGRQSRARIRLADRGGGHVRRGDRR